MSPGRLTRFVATVVGVAVLLLPAAAEATTSQPNSLANFEVRYNAGDEDPAAGPNSFVVTRNDCDTSWHVQYKWGSNEGRIQPPCGETRTVSLAPLGANEYPLQWRSCYLSVWRYPPRLMLVCGDYHDDVVRTD